MQHATESSVSAIAHRRSSTLRSTVPCASIFSFCFHPTRYLYTTFSSSLRYVAQISGHMAGCPPPSPLRCVPLLSSREEFGLFFPRRACLTVRIICTHVHSPDVFYVDFCATRKKVSTERIAFCVLPNVGCSCAKRTRSAARA